MRSIYVLVACLGLWAGNTQAQPTGMAGKYAAALDGLPKTLDGIERSLALYRQQMVGMPPAQRAEALRAWLGFHMATIETLAAPKGPLADPALASYLCDLGAECEIPGKPPTAAMTALVGRLYANGVRWYSREGEIYFEPDFWFVSAQFGRLVDEQERTHLMAQALSQAIEYDEAGLRSPASSFLPVIRLLDSYLKTWPEGRQAKEARGVLKKTVHSWLLAAAPGGVLSGSTGKVPFEARRTYEEFLQHDKGSAHYGLVKKAYAFMKGAQFKVSSTKLEEALGH